MPKPKKHHEFQRILHKHDRRFEFYVNRGKGSHYIVYHPDIDGQPRSVPIPRHGSQDVKPCYIRQVIARFKLPPDIFG